METRKKEKQHLSICPYKDIETEIKDEIKHLSGKIAALDKKILILIESDQNLARRADIIGSVCGLGPVSISTLLSEMRELGSLSGKAAANLAGVAPHPRDSGALRGRRIYWGGRKVVRDVLYTASFAACRHVARWKDLYDRLRETGKEHTNSPQSLWSDTSSKPSMQCYAMAKRLKQDTVAELDPGSHEASTALNLARSRNKFGMRGAS